MCLEKFINLPIVLLFIGAVTYVLVVSGAKI